MGSTIQASMLGKQEISLDAFRNMVNYESGKNKGYVRLCKGANGQIGIEKVNNKIDIGIGHARNVTAKNNTWLRTALLRSFESSLAGTTTDKKSALAEIAKTLGLGDGAKISDKPLSRREVRNAFEAFDKVMNDATSREHMTEHVIEEAMVSCNFAQAGTRVTTYDMRAFAAQYMKGDGNYHYDDIGVIFRDDVLRANKSAEASWKQTEALKKDISATPDAYDTHGAHKHAPMLQDAGTFKVFLEAVEKRAKQGAEKCSLENALRTVVIERGVTLSGDALAKCRQYLDEQLRAKGLNPTADLGVIGTGNAVMTAFMEKVVPAIVRQAQEDFDHLNKGDRSLGKAGAGAALNLDKILNHAIKFFSDYESITSPQGDNFSKQNQLLAKAISEQCEKTDLALGAKELVDDLEELTNTTEDERAKIVKGFRESFNALSEEVRLDRFAAAYVDQCVEEHPVVRQELPSIEEKINNTLDNLTLAAMIANGRKAVGTDAAQNAALSSRGLGSRGLAGTEFFQKAYDKLDVAVRRQEGVPSKITMLTDIAETFLAETMNVKIGNARDMAEISRGLMTTKMTEDDLTSEKLGIPKAIDVYKAGMKEGNVKMKKMANALNRILNGLVKGKQLTLEQANAIQSKLPALAASCVREAIRDFLSRLPGLSVEEDAVALIKKEIGVAINQALDAAKGLADVYRAENRLPEESRRLFNNGEAVVTSFQNKYLSSDIPMEKLKPALSRLYESIRFDTLTTLAKGAKTIDGTEAQNAAKAMVERFEKQATEIVNKVDKLRTDAKAAVLKEFKTVINEAMTQRNTDVGSQKWTVYGGKDVTKEERAALADWFSATLFDKTKENFEKAFDGVYKDPEVFQSKQVNAMALAEVNNPGSTKRAGDQSNLIRENCEKNLRHWLAKAPTIDGKEQAHSALVEGLAVKIKNLTGAATKQEITPSEFGKSLAALPQKTFENFLETAMTNIEARAKKLPMLYARGGKEELKAHLEKDLQVELERLMGARTEVREMLQKLEGNAPKIGDKKLSGPYASLTEGVISNIFEETAMEVAQSKNPELRKSRYVGQYFVSKLERALDFNVNLVQQNFEAFVVKLDEAMKNIEPLQNRVFEEIESDKSGLSKLPPSVRAHYESEIKPKLRQALNDMVTNNPVKFIGDAKDKTSTCFKTIDHLCLDIGIMLENVALFDLPGSADDDYRIEKLLSQCGFVPMGDSAEDSAQIDADGNLITEVKEEAFNELKRRVVDLSRENAVAQAMPEKLNQILDAGFASNFATFGDESVKAAGEAAKAYVKAAVKGVCDLTVGGLQLADFNNVKYPVAADLFEKFLDKYEGSVEGSNVLATKDIGGEHTVRDLARSLFAARYNTVAKAIATDPAGATAKEPLLNGDFLSQLNALYSSTGVGAVLDDMLYKEAASAFEKLAGEKQFGNLVHGSPDDGPALKAFVKQNEAQVKEFLKTVAAEARNAILFGENAQTLEGLQRWSKNVSNTFTELLEKEFKPVNVKCNTRYSIGSHFDSITASVVAESRATLTALTGLSSGPLIDGVMKRIDVAMGQELQTVGIKIDQDTLKGEDMPLIDEDVKSIAKTILDALTSPKNANDDPLAKEFQTVVKNHILSSKVGQNFNQAAETCRSRIFQWRLDVGTILRNNDLFSQTMAMVNDVDNSIYLAFEDYVTGKLMDALASGGGKSVDEAKLAKLTNPKELEQGFFKSLPKELMQRFNNAQKATGVKFVPAK